MTSIRTHEYEIEIAENRWRIFDFFSLTPQFEISRGDGVMRYTATYGEAHGLPGDQLSRQYAQAVVVGFDTKSQIWRLGLHVSENPGQKPNWIELVHWPAGNSHEVSNDAQRAGRVLAEYVGVPLKLFGVRKSPQDNKTGPLVPHKRVDVQPSSVLGLARAINLPLEFPGMWCGMGKNGIMLRLAKNMTTDKAGDIAPSYQMCEVDKERKVIKLLPPTGLLGAFFSTPGRQIDFKDVRNVEFRHTVLETTEVKSDDSSELLTQNTIAHYIWEVYVTLEGEALLLARTMHVSNKELDHKRISDVAGTKFDTNFDIAVDFYRKHEEDQQHRDEAEHFAHSVAIRLAADLGVRLVETEIGNHLL